jgi:UDP-N-acetylmuramyl pentapeptide phosphotransferase/UDP-N-acetylglucosamine-1-phosphate transferase
MSNVHDFIQNILNDTNVSVVVVLLTAFIISLIAIPIILEIARSKNFLDKPNGRTSHYVNTPTLGGIALFAGIIISLQLFGNGRFENGFNYIVACLTIILFIGIRDDIYIISFAKKLFGQIIVILILIFFADIKFSNLHGFLGIYEISLFASIILSLFVFIVIINCINLIDGVDGLASGLSILSTIVFSLYFYDAKMFGSLLISISLLGSLIPFFIYNVFGKKNKLFMGDTGALIIGVISVVLVVKFNELSVSNSTQYILTAAPAMSIAILFIPLYDTLQVFVIRVFNKRSPFSPDKNHLHHRLLNLGLNHIQTSSILITLNAIIIISSYLMQSIGIFALTVLLLLIGLMFSTFLWYLAKRKKLV